METELVYLDSWVAAKAGDDPKELSKPFVVWMFCEYENWSPRGFETIDEAKKRAAELRSIGQSCCLTPGAISML